MPNGNFLFSSVSVLLCLGDNSLVHELRVMTAVEQRVNATYYVQHSALKSVYGKRQPVIGGKLSSFYRTVFKLTQGLRDWVILGKIQTG